MPARIRRVAAPEADLLRLDALRQSRLWPKKAELTRLVAPIPAVLPDIVRQAGIISLVFTDDASIHRLNHMFRGMDKPTNVLSFPSASHDEQNQRIWGDVVLAYETIAREAEAQAKTFDAHVIHMVVHGVLHLFGFDHMTDPEAQAMESMEIEILQRLGIDNPYADWSN